MIHLHGVVRSISQELLPRMLIAALVITLFKTGQVSNKQNPGGWVCQYQEIVFLKSCMWHRSCEWRRPSNASTHFLRLASFLEMDQLDPWKTPSGTMPVFSIPATSKLKMVLTLEVREKTRGQSFWWQLTFFVHFPPRKQRTEPQGRGQLAFHIYMLSTAHTLRPCQAQQRYILTELFFHGMMFPPSSLYQ